MSEYDLLQAINTHIEQSANMVINEAQKHTDALTESIQNLQRSNAQQLEALNNRVLQETQGAKKTIEDEINALSNQMTWHLGCIAQALAQQSTTIGMLVEQNKLFIEQSELIITILRKFTGDPPTN